MGGSYKKRAKESRISPFHRDFHLYFRCLSGTIPTYLKINGYLCSFKRKKGVKVGYLYECDAPDADCHNYGKQAGEHDMARGYAA